MLSKMWTLKVPPPIAPLGNFTDQGHVHCQPSPTRIREKCAILFARDPSFLKVPNLLTDRKAELAAVTKLAATSEFDCNSRLQTSPAGCITQQFFQSRTKSRNKSQELETAPGYRSRRVLDFLDAIINRIPQSSGKNRRDSSPSTSSTENPTISGQAQNSKSPWHPSNIIFATDFDVTCTLVDSSKVLVRAAEVAAVKRPDRESLMLWQPGNFNRDYKAALKRHTERTRATVQTLFSEHKDKDSDENENCEESCSSDRSEHKSGEPQVQQETKLSLKALSNKRSTDGGVKSKVGESSKLSLYREAELRMALTKLAMLEIMCNQDVISLGVLRGPTREEIRAEAAARVRLRANCSKVLQRLARSGTAIHVVSANWSRDLIEGGLPKLPDGKLFVHSNDLLFDSAGISLGVIYGTVVDAFDKEELLRALRCSYDGTNFRMNRLKAKLEAEYSPHPRLPNDDKIEVKDVKGNPDKSPILVFVGDSHTDLLGLLDADLGVVIGESLLMRRIMALFGIQLRPLAEASTRISVARVSSSMLSYRRSGFLFEARSWTDVETCLFGDRAELPP